MTSFAMSRIGRRVAVWLAITTGSIAAQLPQGVTKVASVEGITEYDLSNGLRVLIFPDASKPTATVNITVLVGSRHEGYGETGMAHLLEHMVFKGTPTFPDRKSTRLNSSHTEIYTLSLHDALPIYGEHYRPRRQSARRLRRDWDGPPTRTHGLQRNADVPRSEEHTSELQSHRDLHSFPTRRSSDLR